MLGYAILTTMALAGYVGAPPWLVLFGAAGVASEGWWLKLRLWHGRSRQPWSAKITTYFITGILANIGLSAVAYGAGRAARALAG